MCLPSRRVFFGLVRSQLGDFFFLRHVLKRANKGLCEQYPLAFLSTAAPGSEPLAEPCP
jgi:hypothetical protein